MGLAQRQNNFNLLRIILALLVIVSHSPELTDGDRHREILTMIFDSVSFGEVAVDGFFLLSGYLIVQSWDSQPHAWSFLKKRILRIYPGFLVASAVCAFIVGPLGAEPQQYFRSFWPGGFVKGCLFLESPVVPDVFQGQPYPTINGAMWTISREFGCYLLVLIAGVTGLLRLRHGWLALATVVYLTFAALKMDATVPDLNFRDLRLACLFLNGGCFYLYRSRLVLVGRVAAICLAATLLLMLSEHFAELALSTMGGYALLYAAAKRSEVLSRYNRLPDVSYGVYLYGWPIQKLFLWYHPGISPWTLLVLTVPAVILIASISWYLIEKPALRFKAPQVRLTNAELMDPELPPTASQGISGSL